MRPTRPKFLLIVFCGGLLCGLAGNCLPANFFADLAGDVVGTAADAIVAQILEALLDGGAGAS